MSERDLRIVKKADNPKEAELQKQAVQRLAANVESEAHWQQILASAVTEESRAELERVVGPLLKFRRAAPCTTPGCESLEVAIWQPILVVCSPVDPEAKAWVPIELRLCETCKAEARLEDFLTNGVWEQILSQIQSGWPPVRRLTTLSWDRIH